MGGRNSTAQITSPRRCSLVHRREASLFVERLQTEGIVSAALLAMMTRVGRRSSAGHPSVTGDELSSTSTLDKNAVLHFPHCRR
jgi:hypothetical protein